MEVVGLVDQDVSTVPLDGRERAAGADQLATFAPSDKLLGRSLAARSRTAGRWRDDRHAWSWCERLPR